MPPSPMRRNPPMRLDQTMALEIINNGLNNEILLDDPAALAGRVVINGDGARLCVGRPMRGGRFEFTLHDGCILEIGETLLNNGVLRIHAAAGGHVGIGPECVINGLLSISVPEPGRVDIGRNCLFSDQASLQTSDFHAIFDRASRRRINQARDIEIGAHVWVGLAAVVLKGTVIGRGAIIGAHAVVAGRVPEFCAAAGNPARVISQNLTWGVELQDEMPAALDNPLLYGETALEPAFRLLRARQATALQAFKAHEDTLADSEKQAVPAGAWVLTGQLHEDGDYWALSRATLDGNPVPPHINLAVKQHWELVGI